MIAGLLGGDEVVGIDIRPLTGRRHALVKGTASDRVYVVNPATGAATQVGGTFATRLVGTSFGVDFNPVVDRIRIVSDSDENLRVHPDTGTVAAVDGTLAYKAGDVYAGMNPSVTAVASRSNVPGGDAASTPPTDLYGIDADRDALVRQDPPNAGTLNTDGFLNVGDATSVSGLDSAGSDRDTPRADAVLVVNGEDALYTVNTDTASATKVGAFPASASVEDLAVADPGFVVDATASGTEGSAVTVTVRRVGDTRFAGPSTTPPRTPPPRLAPTTRRRAARCPSPPARPARPSPSRPRTTRQRRAPSCSRSCSAPPRARTARSGAPPDWSPSSTTSRAPAMA